VSKKKNKQKKLKNQGLRRKDLERLWAAGGATVPAQNGLLAGLGRLLPSGRNEQFLLGLVLGGAAAYVLSDDEMRTKLFKGAMKAYAGVIGTAAELKEQLADAQAEVEAEQNGLI
jgi:hypothetical protein